MSNFVEAFKCECGYLIPKYGDSGVLPVMPAFTFHNCCPNCGRTRDKIKLVTGKWKYKRVVQGWWPFRATIYQRDYFVESNVNEA